MSDIVDAFRISMMALDRKRKAEQNQNLCDHLYKTIAIKHGLSDVIRAGINPSTDMDKTTELWECVHCGFHVEVEVKSLMSYGGVIIDFSK